MTKKSTFEGGQIESAGALFEVGEPGPELFKPGMPESKQVFYKDDSEVEVKLVNTDTYDGKYLVYEIADVSKAYFVNTEDAKFSTKPQRIKRAILDTAERPYNWDEEIDRAIPSTDVIRLQIWRNGLVRKEDLEDKTKAQNSLYGVFPAKLLKGE